MNDNSLDILNILDVLKNQDLYQERLQAIKDATQALNEGKYIGTTMEQAKTLMEAAQAAKELAEKEISEKRDILNKDRHAQETRLAIEFEALQKQRNEVNQLKIQNEQRQLANSKALEGIEIQRKEVYDLRIQFQKKEIEAEEKYQRYAEKVRQLQAIIN